MNLYYCFMMGNEWKVILLLHYIICMLFRISLEIKLCNDRSAPRNRNLEFYLHGVSAGFKDWSHMVMDDDQERKGSLKSNRALSHSKR